MDLGVHLPLMQFAGQTLSLRRLEEAVDAARDCGFAAVSANDHFVFSTPWLDGPTALASVIERSGDLTLATTVSLAVLRGPVPLAKTLAALDVLSEGRLIAALGPGSSIRDYEALGIPFDERWKRFDEAISALRALLSGGRPPRTPTTTRCLGISSSRRPQSGARHPPVDRELGIERGPAPGREIRRRLDASAYNTTPESFGEARELLAGELVEPRPRRERLSERPRHDVDVGGRGSRGG